MLQCQSCDTLKSCRSQYREHSLTRARICLDHVTDVIQITIHFAGYLFHYNMLCMDYCRITVPALKCRKLVVLDFKVERFAANTNIASAEAVEHEDGFSQYDTWHILSQTNFWST